METLLAGLSSMASLDQIILIVGVLLCIYWIPKDFAKDRREKKLAFENLRARMIIEAVRYPIGINWVDHYHGFVIRIRVSNIGNTLGEITKISLIFKITDREGKQVKEFGDERDYARHDICPQVIRGYPYEETFTFYGHDPRELYERLEDDDRFLNLYCSVGYKTHVPDYDEKKFCSSTVMIYLNGRNRCDKHESQYWHGDHNQIDDLWVDPRNIKRGLIYDKQITNNICPPENTYEE